MRASTVEANRCWLSFFPVPLRLLIHTPIWLCGRPWGMDVRCRGSNSPLARLFEPPKPPGRFWSVVDWECYFNLTDSPPVSVAFAPASGHFSTFGE